ncbi:uncharacterized protein LOC117318706, partial [Pecten maximus]|uniref:uncharacterized protein LOC117318706 n=1 Tax=Pecten maximus TaxID=6579 RepID=UPI0014581486
MPRKKNWKSALAKKNNTHRLVDTGHVKNSTIDITSDCVTSDRPERLVDTGHVKNSTMRRGDTTSLKRVHDLPSGAENMSEQPLGTKTLSEQPLGAENMSEQPLGTETLSEQPSGAKVLPNQPLGTENFSEQPSGTKVLPEKQCVRIFYVEARYFSLQPRLDQQSYISLKFGSVHQASESFPAVSRGMQCTCNSLISLISLQTEQYQASKLQNIDNILLAGDELFRIRMAELKSTNRFVSKMLQFQELPLTVCVFGQNYKVQYHEQIYGCVTHSDWNDLPETLNLQEGVDRLFSNYNEGLVIVGGICSAVYLDSNRNPSLFDSHSHGLDGLSCVDGRAVEISFHNTEHLVNFMFSYYRSANIPMNSHCQFEIQPITIVRQIAVRRSLIDKYFDYQTEKALLKVKHSSVNKKTYMKEYMQKRRQSSSFRDRQNCCSVKSKQKARKNPEYKLKGQQSTLQSMAKARQNEAFRANETKAKQRSREKIETRQKERLSTLKTKTKVRQSKEFRECELQAKQRSRENIETKEQERQRTLKSMTKARQNHEYRESELLAKQWSRENIETKQKDRQSTLKTKTKARQNNEYRESELQAKQRSRENIETKQKDRQSTLKTKTKARQKEFRDLELKVKQTSRENIEMKQKERQSMLKSKTKARQNPEFCKLEMKRKRLLRTNPLQLEKERVKKQENRKMHRQMERSKDRFSKTLKRKAVELVEHERSLSKKRQVGSTIDESIVKFRARVANGLIYACTCCHQTWFRKSVVQLDKAHISLESKQICTGLGSVDGKEWLCSTCLASLREEKIPKLSVKNGMSWPKTPAVLNLHSLEERLISQRIPFMQIRELPRGGQLSAKGNIVNVPVDIQPTINALPRQLDVHVTIAVKLKKRLSHKSSCFSENIRPEIVIKALKWLMENSELYKNSNIKIDHTWEKRITEAEDELITELTGSSHSRDDRDSEEVSDGFCEISAEDGTQGNTDTLVDEAVIDTNKIYVFAPGENQKPVGLYEDKDAEYLCFPSIFCGQRRVDNENRTKNVYYSDIAKWELRSVDRRAAQSVPNIFFKLKKIQIKQVGDKVNLAVRRCKSEGKKITAGQVRNEPSANQIVRLNEGYYIFRTLRNSPAYLSSKKKDAFAMIRQLGLPTWFMSLSSADTRWPDLLQTLATLDGTILSDENLESLDWKTKTNLVKKDPVTCARYFDNRVQEFITTFLKNNHNPIGAITDVFRRVEFQNRGSPHIHMLLWTNDAPKYPNDDETLIVEYIDKYVTCSLQTDDPEFEPLINLQVHKHSKTCKKGGKSVCRFGFPLPPLPQTMLLEPLETDIEQYRKKYKDLQQKMNEYKDGCDMQFKTFLHDVVDMSLEEYIKCIRASLKGPKIFLKRCPSEMRVNYYNPAVLKAWTANLDIQFVLDPYACATYIVSYISKSQRGISAMLDKASQEAAEGNMDLKHQVRHIGNKFLNFVEVSAQEASYLILQMPLPQASRDVVFINTSIPGERVFLLKTENEINELPENSTDIHATSMIERYSKRPKKLEQWCLADYVSQLEVTFPKDMLKPERNEEKNDDDELKNDVQLNTQDTSDTEMETEPFTAKDVLVTLKNGIKIRKRKNDRVIRFVGFSKKTNPENYYREKLLLYLPWRNEQKDILGNCDTHEEHYKKNAETIQIKQKVYEHFTDELEQAKEHAEEDSFDFDEVAPNTEHVEAEDADVGSSPSEDLIHFDPDSVQHKQFDIGPEIGLGSKTTDIEASAVRLPDDQYYTLLQSLNPKQREFHNHVTKFIRNQEEPLYAFLTGGAGTGKSVVIDAVYQTLHRSLCSEEGEDPEDVRIMLCAYTGKAAYNIGGTTLASAFHKKMYQTQQHMHADELNSLRTKFRNLSVVIIDEISMVGNKLLTFINERLQQVTGKKTDFGGISVIAVGDLYQLQPIADSWIFKDLSNPGQGLATNLWKKHFKVFELDEIMRQKGDVQFAELLNRLRHGELSAQDRSLLSERKVVQGQENYPSSITHLFIENRFVDDFNSTLIEKLPTNKVTVKADTDIISQTKMSAEIKNRLIQALPDKQSTTGQLKSSLAVAVDMLYDVSVNLEVSDGLTNGATCVVKHIEYKDSNTRPAIVWVQFDDFKVGTNRRNQYKHLYTSTIDATWTPMFETKRTFLYNRKTFERVQFPLQPSAAKTVHKAQGATLGGVVVSLNQTRARKIPHIHYVALSRVKSLNQLHILDFNELSLAKDEAVDSEMQRLREHVLTLCFRPLYHIEAETKCLFNNARSLHKHFADIKSDPNVYAADIIGIAESRLCDRDADETVSLSDYQIYRNDSHCS